MPKQRKKKGNNQIKPIWYPVLKRGDMMSLLRKEGILSWLDIYEIPESTMDAFVNDLLEFINRACRAVYIKNTNPNE